MRVHVDPHQEDELGHEEAAAQVLVDGRPGALDLAEEPEGEDAHGQTDEGDYHPQLGDPGQDGVVGHQLGGKWKGGCFNWRGTLLLKLSLLLLFFFFSLIVVRKMYSMFSAAGFFFT